MPAPARRSDEQRPGGAVPDVGLDRLGRHRGQGDGRSPPSLALDPKHPVASLGVEVRNVGTERLGDPQSVEPEEEDQGEGPGRVGLGDADEGGQLVTVEARRHGVGPDLGAPDGGNWVAGDARPR